jgi:hypothetical protein
MFTRIGDCIPSWARSIQSTISHPVSVKSILILFLSASKFPKTINLTWRDSWHSTFLVTRSLSDLQLSFMSGGYPLQRQLFLCLIHTMYRPKYYLPIWHSFRKWTCSIVNSVFMLTFRMRIRNIGLPASVAVHNKSVRNGPIILPSVVLLWVLLLLWQATTWQVSLCIFSRGNRLNVKMALTPKGK